MDLKVVAIIVLITLLVVVIVFLLGVLVGVHLSHPRTTY